MRTIFVDLERSRSHSVHPCLFITFIPPLMWNRQSRRSVTKDEGVSIGLEGTEVTSAAQKH